MGVELFPQGPSTLGTLVRYRLRHGGGSLQMSIFPYLPRPLSERREAEEGEGVCALHP